MNLTCYNLQLTRIAQDYADLEANNC